MQRSGARLSTGSRSRAGGGSSLTASGAMVQKGARRLALFLSDSDVLAIMCEVEIVPVELHDCAEFLASERRALQGIWGHLIRFG